MTDHLWLGGTTYGAVDGPAGPSMATKFAVDGPAGPVVGGTISGVTVHLSVPRQSHR